MTDTVRVWLVPVDVSPADLARCEQVLDDGQRARAAAFGHAPDRHRFTVAHGALRILLGRELAAPPEALTWTRGRHGKPELAAPWWAEPWTGRHANLSHSGDLVAVAIAAARPVGVDVQRLLPGQDPVAMSARFFAPDEASYVAAGSHASARADRFARLWTRKEAVIKAAGGRLWPNLGIGVHGRDLVQCAEPASLHRVADVSAPPGYRAAVALAGAAPYVVELAGWPALTNASPPSRSPRAADRGSAAAPGRARERTGAPRRPAG